MDLILTHEHGDFDALASQLAAHKLVPAARPLLPHRLNRNVRRYMHLYRDELPFIEQKDLPRELASRVIVVDTQHVPSVRGVGPGTTVEIIDHHSRREALDPAWQVSIEPVGATTTALVERIRAAGLSLTQVEATLLMLGIYEDTGSLSYGTTTARDAFAAAWLLEQGASLDVVREFLHHPLAEEQRVLYERLLEGASTHLIEGHVVVVAAASAPEMVEEVATLAHKLRDLFDPAALFVLVDLGTHIQMVARSSVDAIDVGLVAEQFGGGGHGRAAAALLKEVTLAEAQTRLLEALHRLIRPSLCVSDLMSHGVQTLPPGALAREAASQMRRYGYEGFPIVRDGQIAGLLTRRAVDRAIDHGLTGIRVDQIMEAGRVSVAPTDSVAMLQQVMMATGWGQIPVVDADGQILGVVTRTDLIKHLGHNGALPSRQPEIVRRIEAALSAPLLAVVREVGRIADELGLNLYVVGGVVRDLLLDQPIGDMDFVVEGDAIALTARVCRALGGEMRSHRRFGTGKWLLGASVWQQIGSTLGVPVPDPVSLPTHIDFISARTEFYRAPTALPEVEQSSIKLDLHRRDFTINTLAIRLNPGRFGQLLDFYGGEADLREGRIRVLHSLSFVDDPTRILRAVRLEQRLGFRIEPRTAELITQALPLLDRVSGDRIRHEIELILDETRPEDSFCRLSALGALATLHPDLYCESWTSEAFARLRQAVAEPLWPEIGPGFDTAVSYFALLTYHLSEPALRHVCTRLKVRARTVEDLERLQHIRGSLSKLDESCLPSLIDRLLSGVSDRILLAAWAAASTDVARRQIVDFACRIRHIQPVTDGTALIARGLQPGPMFKRILQDLRAAWLDGAVQTPAEEETHLQRLLMEDAQ